jgi:hypothetical protein
MGPFETRRYPDVVAAVARLKAATLVLDGELAVFDQQLRSRFEWLREPDPTVVAPPPVLIAFDVLYAKGRDIRERPLRERRARLEDLLAGADFVYAVRRLAPDGLAAWKQVVERGCEGYVAKDNRAACDFFHRQIGLPLRLGRRRQRHRLLTRGRMPNGRRLANGARHDADRHVLMIAGCEIRWPDWELSAARGPYRCGAAAELALGAGDVYWMEIVRTCWARTNPATCLI